MARLPDNERRSIQVDFVYDVETEHWDTFVVGGLYTPREGFKIYWWDNNHNRGYDDYCDTILTRQGEHGWAHNGGRYDTLCLLDYAAHNELNIKLMASGQRIICAEVQEGPKLLDSFALIPLALKLAATIGGEYKGTTGLECRCDVKGGCGGYCRIKRYGMTGSERKKLAEYLEQDCRATFKMLRKLDEFTSTHDLDLGMTIGSSAWRSARRIYGLPNADWAMGKMAPLWYYTSARSGYYGGRTQVFKPESDHGFRYDINSAYPAALSQIKLPVGEKQFLSVGSKARRAFDGGLPGIYTARVEVPEMFVPPLPVRGHLRITYPVGTLVGSWTSLELHYAESIGCRVLDVLRAFVWEEEDRVLKAWCDRVWGLRAAAGPKTGLGMWLKWYANSLTGKLGQNPIRESAVFNPDMDDPKWQICTGCGDVPGRCTRRCQQARPIDRITKRMWTKKIIQMPACGHIQWAAFLTASTRVTLHRQAVDDGQGGRSMVYCDTDSIISESERSQMIEEDGIAHPRLGWWKCEGEYINFRALAPKTYRFTDRTTDKFKAKSKGIPEAEKVFGLLEAGKDVLIDRGVLTWKSASKAYAQTGKFFQRKHLTRGIRADGMHFGDRRLGTDGLTYPPRQE
jgi:hypothetical protein